MITEKRVVVEGFNGVPSTKQDGRYWLVGSDEPDYCAAGNTLDEAKLNYWEGLARTLLERAGRGLPLTRSREHE